MRVARSWPPWAWTRGSLHRGPRAPQTSAHSRSGAGQTGLSLMLYLIIPIIAAANPIDPIWVSGCWDEADADQVLSQTMSPEGLVGSATPGGVDHLGHTPIVERSMSRHTREMHHFVDARGPPGAIGKRAILPSVLFSSTAVLPLGFGHSPRCYRPPPNGPG